MIHGSLFSGLDGFSLAAEWMKWRTLFHCEKNSFCQKVIKFYWPYSELYDDIITTDFNVWRGRIDVLSGGFPCQPFSTAGEQQGAEDHRYLWPEMLRAIREIKPRWVVAENVYGLVTKKFESIFTEILSSLEAEGYEVQSYIIPASAVGANHERYRVWIVAYSGSGSNERRMDDGRNSTKAKGVKREPGEEIRQENERERLWTESKNNGKQRTIADSKRFGQSGSGRPERQVCSTPYGNWKASWVDSNGGWPTVAPVCNGVNGLPAELDTDAISYKEWSEESLTAGGNAIVPQIALEIFKAIDQYEKFSDMG